MKVGTPSGGQSEGILNLDKYVRIEVFFGHSGKVGECKIDLLFFCDEVLGAVIKMHMYFY